MSELSQNLYITYSNQKARDLKKLSTIEALDKVITLDRLILELFESDNFEIIINEVIASSIIHKIIQTQNIDYFSYLDEDAASLTTIYNFIVKCKRNDIALDTLLTNEKLKAVSEIIKAYEKYKKVNHLVDISDIENIVLSNLSDKSSYKLTAYTSSPYLDYLGKYKFVYMDEFNIENINYIKSHKQEMILKCLSTNPISNKDKLSTSAKIIKPSHAVFDNIDEVKTAIKITRKLLEDGIDSNDILIVASDIQEYAPLYKLFLSEYEIKGYSSIGTPLSSFYKSENPQVQSALNDYKSQVQSLELLYKKLDLTLSSQS